MLCVNNYTREYIDQCRSRINDQVAMYKNLVKLAARQKTNSESALRSAIETFEPVFFNNMLVVMDDYFIHRNRTLERNDGNPLNEVRMLSQALMKHQGVMTDDNSIKYVPAKSVLKYRFGDSIKLNEIDFKIIYECFFEELENKYMQ